MADNVVFRDFDGDLIAVESQPGAPRYIKQLPHETAWRIDDFRTYVDSGGTIVADIQDDPAIGAFRIRYQGELIRPGLAGLKAAVAPDGRFTLWRAALLGRDLSLFLSECGAAGVPQLTIHPESIAIRGNRFVVLPSMIPELLPQLPSLARAHPWWLPFIAPEVLRTRAAQRTLSRRGGFTPWEGSCRQCSE